MKVSSALMFKLFFLAAFFAIAMAAPYGSPYGGSSPPSNNSPQKSPPSNGSPYGGSPSNNSPHQSPPSSPYGGSPPSKNPHPKSPSPPSPPPPPAHKPAPSKVFTTVKPTPTKAAPQCNTGAIQCCDSLQSAKSSGMSDLLGVLGVVVDDLTASIGSNCSPLSLVGLSAGECNASPVCCENNNFNGLISLGCSPINI